MSDHLEGLGLRLVEKREVYAARDRVVDLQEIETPPFGVARELPRLALVSRREKRGEPFVAPRRAVNDEARDTHNARPHELSPADRLVPRTLVLETGKKAIERILAVRHVSNGSYTMRHDERQVQMRREFRGEMNVHVPKTRDQELPRAIDDEPGGAFARSRGQPADPAVLDLDRHSRKEGGGLGVDQGDVVDDEELGSGWRLRE